MTLADAARMQSLEARVRELEELVAAYEANERDDGRWEDRVALEDRVRAALKADGPKAGTARLVLHFVAHPGRVVSHLKINEVLHPDDLEGDHPPKVPCIYIHHLRNNLARLGFEDAIETIWGQGYRLRADRAAALRAALGLGHG